MNLNISNDLIYETDSLNEYVCDDINDLFNESMNESMNVSMNDLNEFVIPKNNEKWKQIEHMIYKELLIHINNYKNKLIIINTNEANDYITLLSKNIYTKDFFIQSLNKKTYNRYNILSYLFCLHDGVIIINNKQINAEKGKLILFPEQYSLLNKSICIYGQLCYDNIV